MIKRHRVLGIALCLISSSAWSMKHVRGQEGPAKRVKVSREDLDTQLLLLSKQRSLQPFKDLLAKGADPDSGDGKCSILHYACLNEDYGLAMLLLDEGAQVDARSPRGWMPLHVAAGGGSKEMCKLLVDRKAQVNAQDSKGFTPLHVAAQNGYTEVCRLLVDRGAQVSARLNRDFVSNDMPFGEFTVLHLAGYCNKLEVVKFLLQVGADKNARTQDGRTVLDIARQCGHSALVAYLENKEEKIPPVRGPLSQLVLTPEEEALQNLSAVDQGNNEKVLQLLETND